MNFIKQTCQKKLKNGIPKLAEAYEPSVSQESQRPFKDINFSSVVYNMIIGVT